MIQKFLLVAITALLFYNSLTAQNTVPVISNLRAIAEPGTREIAIRYDVTNTGNRNIRIIFELQTNDKTCSPVQCMEVFGDVGYPVKAGTGKLIVCRVAESFTDVNNYKVKLVAEDLRKPDISQLTREVSIDNIQNDISFLSVKRYFREDSLQLRNIMQKIGKDFTDNKLTLQKQEFVHAGHVATNLVAMLPGISNDNKLFIIGAHWDAVKGSPGSDDNASGVAGVLEVMRVLSKYTFQHSVCFVAFDMEEENLLGSREFVSRLDGNKDFETGLMINLDMIGFYSVQPKSQVFPGTLKDIFPAAYKEVSSDEFRGDFILNTMNENSQEAGKRFDSCARAYVPDLQVVSLIVPDDGKIAPEAFRASDHASFWDASMKAISIGDTGDSRNYNYHSPDDVMEAVNVPFVQRVVKALTATIASLAGITNATTVEIAVTFSSYKPDARIFGSSSYNSSFLP